MGFAGVFALGDGDLPRHHCLGPIEARAAATLAAAAACIFRGITASAPLKRGVGRGLDAGECVIFRGITASAPLKHPSSFSGLGYGGIFRGITASAPLKRRPRPAQPRHADRIFRGITASAPLKLLAGVIILMRKIDLPRHHCLGPIEAYAAGAGVGQDALIFRGITASAPLKQ